MYCLDTYALIEIHEQNPQYVGILKDSFVPNLILAEFYQILLRDFGEKTADYWVRVLAPSVQEVSTQTMLEAARHRITHKKRSFFDCAGFMHAQMNDLIFVTGDKAFANEKNVLYLK